MTEIVVAPALPHTEPPVPQKALELSPPEPAAPPIIVVEKKPDPPVVVIEKKPDVPVVVVEKKAEPPVMVIEEKKQPAEKKTDPPMIIIEQKKPDPLVVVIEKQPEKKIDAPVIVVEKVADKKSAEPVFVVMQPTVTSKPVSAWVKDVHHACSESKLRQMQNAESTSTLDEDLYDEPQLARSRSRSPPRQKRMDTVVFKERSRWDRFLCHVCCRPDVKNRSVNYQGTRYYMDKQDQHERETADNTLVSDRARHYFLHEGVLHVLVGKRGTAKTKPVVDEAARKERHMAKQVTHPARHTQYDPSTRRRGRPMTVRSAEVAARDAYQRIQMHRHGSRGHPERPRSVRGVKAVEAEGH